VAESAIIRISLTRRRLVGLTPLLALAACRPPTLPPVIETLVPARPTPTPARPRPNGPDALAIGVAREPTSVVAPPGGEGWGGAAYAGRLAANLLFSQLVGLDDRGTPTPDLAEAVPTLDRGARFVGEGDARQLEVTFRLRPATWSDRQPVTARDVVFSWELALNPRVGATLSTEHRYERVEARDDRTVVFTSFSEQSARAAAAREPNRYGFLRDQRGPVVDPLFAVGLPNSFVYPAHAIGPLVDGQPRSSPKAADLFATSSFAKNPVGSGPYALREWQPGAKLVFAARADYARGAPKVTTIVVAMGTPERLQAALAGGEVDLLTWEATGATPIPTAGTQLTTAASWAREAIDVNLNRPPLNDVGVREALLRALDRATLAGPPQADPASARYPFDPTRAEALLDGAGWARGPDGTRAKSGVKLEPTLLTTDTPEHRALAQTLRDQLARVGVAAKIDARPAAELFDPVGGRLAQRDFDLALYGRVDGPDRLSDLAARYAGAAIPSRANGFAGENYPGLRSADLDRLFADAAATIDPAAREGLRRQIEETLLDELPTLPIVARMRVAVAPSNLRNLRLAAPSIGETWNAHEWAFSV
jgi:peptide/nickel transport system substrate-binding protein